MRRAPGAVLVSGLILVLVVACGADPSETPERRSIVSMQQTSDVELDLNVDSCRARDLAASVTENAEEVRIEVVGVGGISTDCSDRVVARLAAPLGDRDIVDTTSGARFGCASQVCRRRL